MKQKTESNKHMVEQKSRIDRNKKGKAKFIKASSLLLASSIVVPSISNVAHAGGIFDSHFSGNGGVKLLYTNYGNPNSTLNNYKVADIVSVSVRFPETTDGKNDYSTRNQKVTITYSFNPQKTVNWQGRPFYWFTLPKGVMEPKEIIFKRGDNTQTFHSWGEWMTNTRFVASRYQNQDQSDKFNAGNPNAWEKYNDRTKEYKKSFNSSFNKEFNRMLDEQDGGWYDNSGNTRHFAKRLRDESKSIYIDWELAGNTPVTITISTEVKDPIKFKQLMFGAGVFNVFGNVRLSNIQSVNAPHLLTMAEQHKLKVPAKKIVKDINNIGEEIKNKIKDEVYSDKELQKLLNEQKDKIKVDDNGSVTVTYYDGSRNMIPGNMIVEKYIPYNERITPKIPSRQAVKNENALTTEEKNKLKDAIWNENEEGPFREAIDSNKDKIVIGKNGQATINYKDNTSDTIEGNKLVYRYTSLAERFNPLIPLTIGVKNKNQLTDQDRQNIKDKLWEENKNKTEFVQALKTPNKEAITIATDGTATFTYKDDSTDTILGTRLIYQIPPMNELYEPKAPARKEVKNPQSLSEDEKTKLKQLLWETNTDLHSKLKGQDKDKAIQIDADGKATFTYTDDTTDEIAGVNLVYKKGEEAKAVTKEVNKNGYKFFITPIVVDDMNNISENLWADAARRFIYDNFDWDGKNNQTFESLKHQDPLLDIGGQAIAEAGSGWDSRNFATTKNPKAKSGTQNLNISTGKWGQYGIERIKYHSGESYLDIQGMKQGAYIQDQLFSLTKSDLFLSNAGAFDAEEAKKEADKIIDDLVDKGLSKEEADKIKKEIEEEKGKGKLDQDKVNELIKKANDKATEEKKKKAIDDAKNKAKDEIGGLTDLSEEKRNEHKKKLDNADTPEKVQKILDEAKQDASKEKAKKDAEKALNDMKEKAKQSIDGMDSLSNEEKEKYKKEIGSATDESAINKIVDKAKEEANKKAKEKAEAEALQKAKDEAEKEINGLSNLSNDEKNNFKNEVKTQETIEKVKEKLDAAKNKNEENKKKLDDLKALAKDEIDKHNYLSEEEKKKFKDEIEKATDENGVNAKKEKAKAENLKKAKIKVKEEISKLENVDQGIKAEKQTKVDEATTVEEVEKILEDIQKIDADKKAEKDLEKAKALKEEYKKKIDEINGLDEDKKNKYKEEIEKATSKEQMDSIVEYANAEVKRQKAREEIDRLKHLNNAQKKDLKDNLDGVTSDADIDNIVSNARNLDKKMDILQKMEDIAKGNKVKALVQAATTSGQTDKVDKLTKAIEESKKVTVLDGENADAARVDELIDNLRKAIDEIGGKDIKVPTSKEELSEEIKKSKETKNTDKYVNATPEKKNKFDEELQKAEQILEDANSTQDQMDEATQKLVESRNDLDGTFKLEKKDESKVFVKSPLKDGVAISDEKDKKAILDKIKNIPEGAIVNHGGVKTVDGKKKTIVEVTKDGITKTIEIEVEQDATAPTLAISSESVTITKKENFTPITINVSDNESGLKDTNGLIVEGLPNDWLEFDSNTKQIKLKNGISEVPNTANTINITVKVIDKVGNETTKTISITVQNQADKYKPVSKETKYTKNRGESTGEASNYIKNADNTEALPQGTSYKWKDGANTQDSLTLDTKGTHQKTIQITYPDGSTKDVNITFEVSNIVLATPVLSKKSNDDITIKAPADNVKTLEVIYKKKGETTDTKVLLTKSDTGEWNNLPEGFTKLDNGDILISNTIVEKGSTISVKAKADGFDDSDMANIKLSNERPTDSTESVFIKGEANVGNKLSKEDKDRVIASLKDVNKNGGTPTVAEEASIKQVEDKKLIDVTITYQDGSTHTITVPVVGDNKAPIISDIESPTITAKEGFNPINISVNDEGSGLKGTNGVVVEGLPNYLIFDKTTNTIKFKEGITEVPADAQASTEITVKAIDNVGNESIKKFTITVQKQSSKYSPVAKEKVSEKNINDKAGKASQYVKNETEGVAFPSGTTIKWKGEGNQTLDDITLDTAGDISKKAVITYPDGSTKELDIAFKVWDVLTAPRLTAKNNGDVEISIDNKTTIVKVTYTAEGSDTEKTVEITKDDQGNWNLPEGFVLENNNIILKDSASKNGTKVGVVTKSPLSKETVKVEINTNGSKVVSPSTKVYIKGTVDADTVISSEDKDKIIASLSDENKNGATPSIPENTKYESEGDKFIAPVKLTYPDGSTTIVKVPVESDLEGPTITANDVNTNKLEKFAGIDITITDSGSGNSTGTVEVEGLPEWLEFDKTNNKIKLKSDLNPQRIPDNATVGTNTITIKATDNLGNQSIKTISLTIEKEKSVLPKEIVQIDGSDSVDSIVSSEDFEVIKKAVDDNKNETTATVSAESNVKVTKNANGQSVVIVKLTYDDGFTRNIEVPVVQKDIHKYGYKIPKDKVKINDKNNLKKEDKEKVKEALKKENPEISDETHDIVVGDDGTTSITKKNPSENDKKYPPIPGERLVEPTEAIDTEVKIPSQKVKVEDATKLTEEEKAKVKKALEESNNFASGTTIEIKGDGTAIITFLDGSIKSIAGKDLVESEKTLLKSIADQFDVKIPTQKTEVSNLTKLTDEEKDEIRNKIYEANPDFPQQTIVSVAEDGTATVRYSDDSVDTIMATDLVALKEKTESEAKLNLAKVPAKKLQVENVNNLTAEEKAELEKIVKELNPKAKEVKVGNDGTATLVYGDGSENTITGDKLVEQKEGVQASESDATKNPAILPEGKVKVGDTTHLTDSEMKEVESKVKASNPKAKNVQVAKDGTATLIYEDGSANTISGDNLVEERKIKAELVDIAKPNIKVEVVNPSKLTDDEKTKVKKNIEDSNIGKLDGATINIGNDGTTTIIFDDGSAKTIDKKDLVEPKVIDNNIAKEKLTIADKTDVLNPEYTEVGNISQITDEEKENVKSAVIKANPNKLDEATIEVLGDGTVVITYKDGSVDIIAGSKTVKTSKNANSAWIQPELEKFPLDKYKEMSKDFVTEKADKEKSEIEGSDSISEEEKNRLKSELKAKLEKILESIDSLTDDNQMPDIVNSGIKDIENTYTYKPKETEKPEDKKPENEKPEDKKPEDKKPEDKKPETNKPKDDGKKDKDKPKVEDNKSKGNKLPKEKDLNNKSKDKGLVSESKNPRTADAGVLNWISQLGMAIIALFTMFRRKKK